MTVDNTQPKHVKTPKLMLVRYGRLGTLGWFEHDEAQIPKVHSKVLIKTERGLELGEIVGPHCYKAGHFRHSPEVVNDYYKGGGEEEAPKKAGEFVRFATAQDVNEDIHLKRDGIAEMETARKMAAEHHVPIDIVDVEHIFGGERIIFYFVAETRIDFRELVRLLAREYQTRIEMRQIGSRDEARLMSDYENCGQECCCARFMRILKPVNMRMAKLQKATLDPSKISGYCGRLKCCLRFEDDTYRDLRERLPKRGTRMQTPEGMGTVIDAHILAQLVIFQLDEGRRVAIPVESLSPDAPTADARQQAPDAGMENGEAPERPERTERRPRPERTERVPTDEIEEDIVGDIESRYDGDSSEERGEGIEPEGDEPEEELEMMPRSQPGEQEKKAPAKWAPLANRPRQQQNQEGGRPQGGNRDNSGGNRDNNRREGGRGEQRNGQRPQRDQQRGPRPQEGQPQQQGQQGQGDQQPGQGGGRRRRNRRRNRHRGQGPQQGGAPNQQGGEPGQGGGQDSPPQAPQEQ
jgi:cell fate regulator YaaT (PSP1 superfamily)